jgi:hypothetical protein
MDDIARAVGSELVLKDEGLSQATTGLWTGVASMGLAMIGPFTCYTSYFLSLPVALVSVYSSWRAYDAVRGLESARAERTMAIAGLASGGLTALFGAMWAMLFAIILFFYGLMFVLAMIGAAAGQ